MENTQKKIDGYIREHIAELENDKSKLEKQIDKICYTVYSKLIKY